MNVVSLKKPSIAQLECSRCGARADAACNCGEPYVPARTRAARAIAADPENKKSNRAIAKEIGVDEQTVRAARIHGTAGDPAVMGIQGLRGPDGEIRRQGLDGKWRKLPKRRIVADDEMPTEEEADESWQNDLYDHACSLVDRMADKTRRRFFAFIRRKYHEN